VRTIALLLAVLLYSASASAAVDLQPLEKVARAYAVGQPGLDTYRVTILTDKISEMLEKMTANLPPDVPRPPQPKISKYWSRVADRSLIRAEGPNVFPYMQEMVKRFSTQFTIEIRLFLLPVTEAARRAELLATAQVKISKNLIGDRQMLGVVIDFPRPTDLNGAFYGEGIGLPQTGVTRLTLDLDPELEIVNRMEIIAENHPLLAVDIRHLEVKAGRLPEQIMVTAPDGSVDDLLETNFDLKDGFWLPVRQARIVRRGGKADVVEVFFRDYDINIDLPEDVRQQLQ